MDQARRVMKPWQREVTAIAAVRRRGWTRTRQSRLRLTIPETLFATATDVVDPTYCTS